MTTTTTTAMAPAFVLDLSLRAPRSLRTRLGGYAVLPRMLDKCRAAIAGTLGEYHTDCVLDRQFLAFAGIDYAQLRAELAQGRTDTEILAWIDAHAQTPRSAAEIEAWSAYQDRRLPDSDPATAGFFRTTLAKFSQTRADIHTWADLLDLDDHVSFGGTA